MKWKGRNRKWVYGILSESPGRCLVESTRYRIHFTDHENNAVSVRGYADRAASEHRMQELATQAERIHAGLLAPQAARQRHTLTELLDRWERYVRANGATDTGARRQRQRTGDVCDGIEAIRVSDLTPGAVLEWIDGRRRANQHKGRRFGETTAAMYVGACKSFSRWCVQVERCEPVDHLSALRAKRAGYDLRVNRRALSDADLRKLLEATRESESILYGLTGAERAALYLLACSSGLRASELSSLTRSSFSIATGEVKIEASRSKNRKTAVIPIPAPVVRAIKPLLSRSGFVWPNRGKPSRAWWANAARMIRRDLEIAGIPLEVDGRRYDFHALRGQFATDLDRAGVSQTRIQKLMRHSDPKLTAKHYTSPERVEMAEEVGKLKRGRARRILR